MSGRDLLIIVPTRSRPENVERVVDAWAQTDAFEHAELMFVYDGDDPAADAYVQAFDRIGWSAGYPLRFWHEPRQLQLVPKLNKAAALYADPQKRPADFFAIGFAGDDHLPRTRGWARDYVATLRALGTGVVSCPDGYRDAQMRDQLPTQWAMTADIVRELGAMVPAPVEHLYCDDAVWRLARAAECYEYLRDHRIEHMHPVAGTAPDDAQYQRVNSSEQYRRDGRAYRQWRRSGQLDSQAERIRRLRERTLAT